MRGKADRQGCCWLAPAPSLITQLTASCHARSLLITNERRYVFDSEEAAAGASCSDRYVVAKSDVSCLQGEGGLAAGAPPVSCLRLALAS